MIAMAASAALSAIRGTLAIERVLRLLGPDFRAKITQVRTTARECAEEHGLSRLLQPEAPDDGAPPEQPSGNYRFKWNPLTGVAEAAARNLTLTSPDEELLTHLETDVERIVETTLGRAVQWPWVWAANLLPLIAVGHIIWRIAVAWIYEAYLPGSFYGMALGIFAASCLPGYWILSRRIEAHVKAPDFAELVKRIDQPLATAQLRQVREDLQAFLTAAGELKRYAITVRRRSSDAWKGAGFAVRASESAREMEAIPATGA